MYFENISESIRTIQTRIPTPDSVRSSPATPGMSPSPKPGGNQSKIPVRHQTSGASQTSIEDNWSDGEQHQKSARVSFKEEKDIRNIVSIFSFSDTVKSLTEARVFIRIITFSGEGCGRLLEAVVLANSV